MEKSSDLQTPANTSSKKKWIIIGCIVMICLSVAGICFFNGDYFNGKPTKKPETRVETITQGPFTLIKREDSTYLPQYIHALHHLYSQLEVPLPELAGSVAIRKILQDLSDKKEADLTTLSEHVIFNGIARDMLQYIRESGIPVDEYNFKTKKWNSAFETSAWHYGSTGKREYAVVYKTNEEKITLSEASVLFKHFKPVAIITDDTRGRGWVMLDLYLRSVDDEDWTLYHSYTAEAPKTGIKTEKLQDIKAFAIIYKIPASA